jgi:hypothetical protein
MRKISSELTGYNYLKTRSQGYPTYSGNPAAWKTLITSKLH